MNHHQPTKEIVLQMQCFIAETCIGASSLRGQGASGLIRESRNFFKELDLSSIPTEQSQFTKWLDRKTERLRGKYSANAQNFGAARKALNLFLRDVSYNVILNRAFGLNPVLSLLEVPVDSFTAKHLKKHDPTLPAKWSGLKRVTKEHHKEYQYAASMIAKKWKVNRVDLDIFFFREDV